MAFVYLRLVVFHLYTKYITQPYNVTLDPAVNLLLGLLCSFFPVLLVPVSLHLAVVSYYSFTLFAKMRQYKRSASRIRARHH